jgi:manganese/zinc/iron transport system permease protein
MVIEVILMGNWNWSLDGWIVAAGVLCAVAAALLGNFLVLREMSMLGDAISHAVLPGLAAAFMISGSRNSWPMFLGAVIVGVLTAFFTEWIRRVGNVDEGASMGVVFTSLFALGLVMIVQAADHVDLDPGCVLYGAIELTPLEPRVSLLGWQVPPSIRTLAIVAAINLAFVILFFKELKISSFDPALATSVGLNARFMHYALMVLVAVTAVASFETVGNILVVAMLVVPPAAAWMLTNRLSWMIVISVVLGVIAAIGGHLAAITVPGWFGFESTTTAGMMAVVAGLILMLAVLFAPQQGVVTQWLRNLRLSQQILGDDVIALLYRMQESRPAGLARASQDARPTFGFLRGKLFANPLMLRLVLLQARRKGLIGLRADVYQLTRQGLDQAAQLVRSHRLWEQYLVTKAGLDTERIHDKAEQLEHFTDRQLRQQLHERTDAPVTDPHGSPIPPETGPQK